MPLIFFFIILFYLVNSNEVIELSTSNIVLVKNEINTETVSYAIEKIQESKNASKLILFIDSYGGNVEDGLNLINEIQKHNMTCIAQKAYSMAFAILQSCKERYIMQSSRLMQHQISFGIRDSFYKISNYVSYIAQIENFLIELQSKKIRMDKKLFVEKTMNDWWLFGNNAIFNNVADKFVDVTCTKTLINKNFTQTVDGRKFIYSNCPLIGKEREIEKGSTPFFFFM
tara:strand:- start:196 stop:879 length:684 start_codon:yes stop_codon:yes gene_type:complete